MISIVMFDHTPICVYKITSCSVYNAVAHHYSTVIYYQYEPHFLCYHDELFSANIYEHLTAYCTKLHFDTKMKQSAPSV